MLEVLAFTLFSNTNLQGNHYGWASVVNRVPAFRKPHTLENRKYCYEARAVQLPDTKWVLQTWPLFLGCQSSWWIATPTELHSLGSEKIQYCCLSLHYLLCHQHHVSLHSRCMRFRVFCQPSTLLLRACALSIISQLSCDVP